MPAPKVQALVRRLNLHNFRRHEPGPCFDIVHLELDGRPLCPTAKRIHSPGFWNRFRDKCRNLKNHRGGYVMHLECMYCRWLMTKWEREHPSVAEDYSDLPSKPRVDLHLLSPTLADLMNDPAHIAFMAELRASPESAQ